MMLSLIIDVIAIVINAANIETSDDINRIIKDDEDIFIYNMMAPKSLPHFLNYSSLKAISDLAPDIFFKILL